MPAICAEFRVKLHNHAVLADQDVLRRNPAGLRVPLMMQQHAVLAVHRHEELGPREVDHQLLLFLAAVARNMDSAA